VSVLKLASESQYLGDAGVSYIPELVCIFRKVGECEREYTFVVVHVSCAYEHPASFGHIKHVPLSAVRCMLVEPRHSLFHPKLCKAQSLLFGQ